MKHLEMNFDQCWDILITTTKGKEPPRKGILERLLPELNIRYDEYKQKCKSLEYVTETVRSNEEKEALIHCYESPLKKISSILLPSLKRVQAFCPYCLVRHVQTRDHFLPKDYWPDFSIHPANLVDVCYTCNLSKGNRLIKPRRSVLNPYFDGLDSCKLLRCDIAIGDIIEASYSITRDYGADEYLYDVACRHFEEFGLRHLFGAAVASRISNLYIEISTWASQPFEEQEIKEKWEKLVAGLNKNGAGCNHWEVAFFSKLIEMDGVSTHINKVVGLC
ncbi:hypothetical protein [Azospirillum sp. A23]|uniref:hypothetical protein n=1 Tax=Azospirillum sp. A23 TaxID=3160608 RepID=UPI0036F21F93